MADILILLISLADILGVDLIKAAREKLEENDRKYPVARARGSARKYRDL
jgi:NTP pyrophosphatase (non-canonical NTP hydrolase)